jgi:carboxyl-terminal processing protease
MTLMRRAWFALLAVAGLATAGPAQEASAPKPAAGPFVVLVGVGTFTDPAIKPRPTAEADARAVYDLFSDPARLPGVQGRVRLLTGTPDAKRGEKPATRENVIAALKEARAATGKDDLVVFGYFGGGAAVQDRTCLFTTDTVFKDRAKTAVLPADFDPDLRAMQDRKIALFLDVNFKGFDPGKETVPEPTLSDLLKALYNQQDDTALEQDPPMNKVVFLASYLGQTPLSKGDHGLFASLVTDALKGAADTEGYEPDGLVTTDELAEYMDKKGQEQARQIGKTNLEKETALPVLGKGTSHFPVLRVPDTYAKVAERLAALDRLEAAGTLSKEVAEEGKQLVGRMPKLKSRQELRQLYQKLADGGVAAGEFAAERTRIKDSLKLSAEEVERYTRVVGKAIDQVRGKYVKDISAGEWAAMAVKGLYWRLDEPLPDDLAALLKKPKEITRSRIPELLADVRTRLGRRDDIPAGKDVDKTIDGMLFELYVQHRDPHTVYYDKETLKKIDAPLKGVFSGVGIQIRRDAVRDGLLVASPIKGSPAYQAGIQTGDLITEIRREVDPQGEPLTSDQPRVISTKGMKTEAALDIILGKPGTPITLVVEREMEDGSKQTKTFDLKRGRINVETVLGVKRTAGDDWQYWLDPDSKIGYVGLTQFNPTSADELRKVLGELKAAGMKGFILDLRFNGGGRLDQAVKISDLFIDDGQVVSVRYRTQPEERYYDIGFARFTGFPMVVLVNGKSASASEIVAACLRDHERAVIVGERTFGKGSVQNLDDFGPTGGLFKITTARYFPPKGENIDKLSTGGKDTDVWGVRPDPGFEVKLSDEEERELEVHFRDREIIPRKDQPAKEAAKPVKDRQLEKGLEYLRSQVKVAAGAAARKAG